MEYNIHVLSEEILERIFSFCNQYKDLSSIACVCSRWHQIVKGMRKMSIKYFERNIQSGQLCWSSYESKFSPTSRHSHSCARIKDKLYVFGGLSDSFTSYNDMWMFDLSKREWSRPIATGEYPSPKGAASILVYNDYLVLYGGYSHPYSYSFNQLIAFYDEFHMYCTRKHKWKRVVGLRATPRLAGHSASLICSSRMIIFGGCNGCLGNKINDVYLYDLVANDWLVHVEEECNSRQHRPDARYGHAQLSIDDENILVVGGNSSPTKQFDDVWLLSWSTSSGSLVWQSIGVNNLFDSPLQSHSINFVRFNDKLITFGRPRMPTNEMSNATSTSTSNSNTNTNSSTATSTASSSTSTNSSHSSSSSLVETKAFLSLPSNLKLYTIAGPTMSKTKTIRQCSCSSQPVVINKVKQQVNSRLVKASSDEVDSLGQTKYLTKSQQITMKRLNTLKKLAENMARTKEAETHEQMRHQLACCVVHSKLMQMFTLDISSLIKYLTSSSADQSNVDRSPCVDWLTPIASSPFLRNQTPSQSILFSLNMGINEIILFAGMDAGKHQVSNKLYIMRSFNNLAGH